MNAKTNEKLKDTLCKHLDSLAERTLDDLTLKHIQMLTDSLKNLLKIEMLEDVGEDYYSERGGSYRGGSYGVGSYGGGSSYNENSYGRRGGRYSRGRSYGDEMSERSSRGGRSYAGGKDQVMRELEEIMQMTTNEQDREAIRRCMTQIEQA